MVPGQDLVPHEQPDLVQDVFVDQGATDVFLQIRSADARACISVCRPKGTFSASGVPGTEKASCQLRYTKLAIPLSAPSR